MHDMIAVIKTGGKQYAVKAGDTIQIDKLAGAEGDTIQFSEVLLVADEAGKSATVGKPLVEGAEVTAKIVRQFRAKKIRVVKYKAKSHYRRNIGHRQHYTKVEITGIK